MALTRKMLKGMGLNDEQIDSIIDAHTETVDVYKERLNESGDYKKKFEDVQKELDELKNNGGDDWKEKHDKVKADFAEFKNSITKKETRAAKEKAVRAYFEKANITGKALEIAMRGCNAEIEAIELDGEKIKDEAGLKALVEGDFASLVGKQQNSGTPTPNPAGDSGKGKTRAEILAIKDGAQRRQEIAANLNLFPEYGGTKNE